MTTDPPLRFAQRPGSLRFAKGHGTENDFVVLPDPGGDLELGPAVVRALCDRRAGIGGDGVLRVVRAVHAPEAAGQGSAEWFMDYRNADGSIAEMCGNGIRVFGRYLVHAGLARAGVLRVATRAGLKLVTVPAEGDVVVDMGPAVLTGEATAILGGVTYRGVGISMGNPHLVCAVPGPIADLDLAEAPQVDPALFPAGVNVEFVNPAGAPRGIDLGVRMRVYERGVGETRSCGTGAVAVGVAALRAAGLDTGQVLVEVPGGRVLAGRTGSTTTLSGPAVVVGEGTVDPAWLAAIHALAGALA